MAKGEGGGGRSGGGGRGGGGGYSRNEARSLVDNVSAGTSWRNNQEFRSKLENAIITTYNTALDNAISRNLPISSANRDEIRNAMGMQVVRNMGYASMRDAAYLGGRSTVNQIGTALGDKLIIAVASRR